MATIGYSPDGIHVLMLEEGVISSYEKCLYYPYSSGNVDTADERTSSAWTVHNVDNGCKGNVSMAFLLWCLAFPKIANDDHDLSRNTLYTYDVSAFSNHAYVLSLNQLPFAHLKN